MKKYLLLILLAGNSIDALTRERFPGTDKEWNDHEEACHEQGEDDPNDCSLDYDMWYMQLTDKEIADFMAKLPSKEIPLYRKAIQGLAK